MLRLVGAPVFRPGASASGRAAPLLSLRWESSYHRQRRPLVGHRLSLFQYRVAKPSMAQPKALFGGKQATRTRAASPWLPDRKPLPKCVLCVLPRRMRANPIKPLLKGYTLITGDTRSAIERCGRTHPPDLYVLYSPLGWAEPAEICHRIRASDPSTPLIVYAMHPGAGERREVISAGAQAYVARSDDAHNLAGTAGQLMMLSELRSMEAMSAGAKTMQDHIIRRLARLRNTNTLAALPAKLQERLKVQTRRLFASAGGSPAHFERVWPSIYESALERLVQAEA